MANRLINKLKQMISFMLCFCLVFTGMPFIGFAGGSKTVIFSIDADNFIEEAERYADTDIQDYAEIFPDYDVNTENVYLSVYLTDDDYVAFYVENDNGYDLETQIVIGDYSTDYYTVPGKSLQTVLATASDASPSSADISATASDAIQATKSDADDDWIIPNIEIYPNELTFAYVEEYRAGVTVIKETLDDILSIISIPEEFHLTYEDADTSFDIFINNEERKYKNITIRVEQMEDAGLSRQAFNTVRSQTEGYRSPALLYNIDFYNENDERTDVGKITVDFRAKHKEADNIFIMDYRDGDFIILNDIQIYNGEEAEYSFDMENPQVLAVTGIMPLAEIGTELNGDCAYVEAAWTDGSGTEGFDITTGTAPWDDTDGAGDDTEAYDDVIRTFDTIDYSITLATHMRKDAEVAGYHSGKVYFEFIIDRPLKEAQFEPDMMPWIYSKNGEYTITEEKINGITSQVMRGYFVLSSENEGSMSIGEGTSSINLVVRPLAMCNGDTINPIATLWLDYNDVGVDYSGYGTKTNYDYTVTYDGKECEEHEEKEYTSITAPNVKISAVPSIRVALGSRAGESAQGEFDFNTGLETAVNYGIGKEYGRLVPCGACIQILPKANSKTNDMRGVEMPKYGGDTEIKFDIELTSSMSFDDSSTKVTTTDGYTPLLFSIEGNESNSTQSDGRDTSRAHTAFSSFPRNTGGNYCKCYNGGTWTAVQEDNILHITITDYELSLDIDSIPYTNPTGNVNTHTYFNPDECNNYWEIGTYCFSSGEMFILQPYYTDYQNNEGYILNYDGENHSGGTFSMTMKDGSSISCITITSNNEDGYVSTEMTSQSNSASLVVGYNAGGLSDSLYYIEYKTDGASTPLTEGCGSTTQDWVLDGGKLSTSQRILYSGAEGGNLAVATDSMTKFDPDFMIVEDVRENKKTGTLSYGGKIGGWESDKEMIEATADDLVFYSDLNELENDGYTCVDVLDEFRGRGSSDRTHFIDASAKGEVGEVYLLTQYGRVWTISDLAQAMVDDDNEWTNKDAATEYLIGLSDTEIKTCIDKYIPVRCDNKETLVYAKDYPSATFIDLGRDGNTSNTASMLNYTKCYYDEDGYHKSNHEGQNFADCCLLIGWDSDVSIHAAQTGSNGSYVQYYDMDTGQYIVDYDIDGIINRSVDEGISSSQEVYDTVYISVEIPAEMSYIAGSSYIGGEYTDNGVGKQGSVTDGTQLLPGVETEYTCTYYNGNEECEAVIKVTLTIEESADGVVTLLYTLKDVPVTGGNDGSQYLDSIHFSTQIDPMKVSNNDSLSVITTIWTESDMRDKSSRNTYEAFIQINKQSATSLVKHVDKTVAEAESELNYTVQLAVTSSAKFEVLLMDTLPFDGDDGNNFTGDVYVTGLTVSSTESVMDLSGFNFFYTTDREEHGTHSDEWEYGDFINDDGTVNTDIYTRGWKLFTVNSLDGNVYQAEDIPEDDIYAIAIVGKTTGTAEEGIITAEITMTAPKAKAGDILINTATQRYTFNNEVYDLTSTASTRIISRTVTGTVWLDEDIDGGINTGIYTDEQKLSDVKVMLEEYTDGGWFVAKDAYGNDCITYTDASGYYCFNNLFGGNYRIAFGNDADSKYCISDMSATVYEAEGIDNAFNSKADEDKSVYVYLLDSSADEFNDTPEYKLEYQNAGFTKTQEVNTEKIWTDYYGTVITDKMSDKELEITLNITDSSDAGENAQTLFSYDFDLNAEKGWADTLSIPYYNGSGSALLLTDNNVNIEETGKPLLYKMSYEVKTEDDIITIDITNADTIPWTPILPSAGGLGIFPFLFGGSAAAGGASILLAKRKKKSFLANSEKPDGKSTDFAITKQDLLWLAKFMVVSAGVCVAIFGAVVLLIKRKLSGF